MNREQTDLIKVTQTNKLRIIYKYSAMIKFQKDEKIQCKFYC